jgi:hypothetical protein
VREIQHPRRFGKRAVVGDGHQGAQTIQANFPHWPAPPSENLKCTVIKFNFLYQR